MFKNTCNISPLIFTRISAYIPFLFSFLSIPFFLFHSLPFSLSFSFISFLLHSFPSLFIYCHSFLSFPIPSHPSPSLYFALNSSIPLYSLHLSIPLLSSPFLFIYFYPSHNLSLFTSLLPFPSLFIPFLLFSSLSIPFHPFPYFFLLSFLVCGHSLIFIHCLVLFFSPCSLFISLPPLSFISFHFFHPIY